LISSYVGWPLECLYSMPESTPGAAANSRIRMLPICRVPKVSSLDPSPPSAQHPGAGHSPQSPMRAQGPQLIHKSSQSKISPLGKNGRGLFSFGSPVSSRANDFRSSILQEHRNLALDFRLISHRRWIWKPVRSREARRLFAVRVGKRAVEQLPMVRGAGLPALRRPI
jgi:hypothetical protein